MSSFCVSSLVLGGNRGKWKGASWEAPFFPSLTVSSYLSPSTDAPFSRVCLYLSHCRCLEGQDHFRMAVCLEKPM